ncbi:MAG: hypothetical protein ACLQVD_13470, partial [Capsulimonadaceae bacterium]
RAVLKWTEATQRDTCARLGSGRYSAVNRVDERAVDGLERSGVLPTQPNDFAPQPVPLRFDPTMRVDHSIESPWTRVQ